MTTFLDSLARLGAEATKGPWVQSERLSESDDTAWGVLAWCEPDEEYVMVATTLGDVDHGLIVDETNREADAHFIATARNCWEALVAVAAAADEVQSWFEGLTEAVLHRNDVRDLHNALAALRAAVEGEGQP